MSPSFLQFRILFKKGNNTVLMPSLLEMCEGHANDWVWLLYKCVCIYEINFNVLFKNAWRLSLTCTHSYLFLQIILQFENLTNLAHIKIRTWTISGSTQQKQRLSCPN